jgi:RNA polymerase sigma-70 factor, ECF subfamily
VSEPQGASEQRIARQAVLVGLAQCGSLDALNALLQSKQENIFAHILTIVGDSDVARDVLQESLLLIARTIRSLRDPALFNAWAYRIATREAVRRAKRDTRRQQHYPPLSDETMSIATSADVDDAQPELLQAAWSLVAALPPASQLVVQMRYAANMSYHEIAAALEIPLGTVKSRLAYGIAVLRKGMETQSSSGGVPWR